MSIYTIRIKIGAVTNNGSETIPYFTLPRTCPPGGVPFKTEVTFGGSNQYGEFGIAPKTVTKEVRVPCPRR